MKYEQEVQTAITTLVLQLDFKGEAEKCLYVLESQPSIDRLTDTKKQPALSRHNVVRPDLLIYWRLAACCCGLFLLHRLSKLLVLLEVCVYRESFPSPL